MQRIRNLRNMEKIDVLRYLITYGYRETAEHFIRESGVDCDVDLGIIDQRVAVLQAVLHGNCIEAESLVNSKFHGLFEKNHALYFSFKIHHLEELIDAGRVDDALDFASLAMIQYAQSDDERQWKLEKSLLRLVLLRDNCAIDPPDIRVLRCNLVKELNEAMLHHSDGITDEKSISILQLLVHLENTITSQYNSNFNSIRGLTM